MMLVFEEQELPKSNKNEPRIEKIITRYSDILYVNSMSIFAAREAETDKDVYCGIVLHSIFVQNFH